jgi:two-component system, chemotaxis family, chemotaxis protein CheY
MLRILIVEDDYITSHIMNEILSAYGECFVAENGKIAIDMFSKALDSDIAYDVVFLDIMMPELDGQETLSFLRIEEQSRNIVGLDAVKVIMTTALDDYENIRKAFNSQCEGYLVKPIDKAKVAQVMENIGFTKK